MHGFVGIAQRMAWNRLWQPNFTDATTALLKKIESMLYSAVMIG